MIVSACFRGICRRNFLNSVELRRMKFVCLDLPLRITDAPYQKTIAWTKYSVSSVANDVVENIEKATLAQDLACLVDESSNAGERKPSGRMEFKRFLEIRIKKRVKKQYVNGKFQFLMENVIANPETLEDAYNSIRLNSNVDITSNGAKTSFISTAEDLRSGSFDVNANTCSISTRDAWKEVLVLPNWKLMVVQEAIRLVLEVVYRPHFSKISHGCRSGRNHATALKYICKEIPNPEWWFTLHLNKKLDASIFAKLISIMEERIEDPALYAFMESMFNAKVLNLEFGGFPKGHGLPQEGLLSPILINIYLNQFDHEFCRLSMKYEAVGSGSDTDKSGSSSNLRSWFRRHMKASDPGCTSNGKSDTRIHSCRFMDEIFFAISGSKDIGMNLMQEIISYLQNALYLDAYSSAGVLPCNGHDGIRFLGFLVRRRARESPAVRAVHKLKDKIKMFALQKETAWNAGTVRIGKKWLGHGLKKVKESEIKHLADENSILNKVSVFRKAGMETDHWYKQLLKIWMQNVNAKSAESLEIVLSKNVAEPALPRDLVTSYFKFQKHVEQYVSSETMSTLALLPSPSKPVATTEILAPVDPIGKRLLRYGLITSRGHAHSVTPLVIQDSDRIIDWFAGICFRCLRWFSDCSNFDEVKLIICDHVRKSCIRTLASKYHMHEDEIEKRFNMELGRIPSSRELEQDTANESSDSPVFNNDGALMYGILSSATCLLSLARITSQSRPCNCFVVGCLSKAPSVYTLNVMERQIFPGWKTGFATCIHPSLNKRRFGLCNEHLSDLYLGRISLQSIDFGAWKRGFQHTENDKVR